MNKNKYLILLVLSINFLLAGCLSVDSQFEKTKKVVLSSVDKRSIDNTTEFSIGAFNLYLLRKTLDFSYDEDAVEVSKYLRDIDLVQVGVYELNGKEEVIGLEKFSKVNSMMKEAGWTCLIRSMDGDEYNSVFIEFNERGYGSIYLLNIDPEEVVIVHAKGNLSRIIQKAVREHRLKFAMKSFG